MTVRIKKGDEFDDLHYCKKKGSPVSAAEDYIDLDIHIFEPQADRYRVDLSVHLPRYGPVSGYLDGKQLYEEADGTRRLILGASPGENSQRLYQLLFSQENLRQAWAEVRAAHSLRRVRLLIDPGAPELHAIPWELLPEVELAADDRVLGATNSRCNALPATWRFRLRSSYSTARAG